jgi:hypothetical protein
VLLITKRRKATNPERTMRTFIVTNNPTPALSASQYATAHLNHADGTPVLVNGRPVFGRGTTVQEAIANLNKLIPVKGHETRKLA